MNLNQCERAAQVTSTSSISTNDLLASDVEAEAAILYGSGSRSGQRKRSRNRKTHIGSGSDKNLPLPLLPLVWYLKQDFYFSGVFSEIAILEEEAG